VCWAASSGSWTDQASACACKRAFKLYVSSAHVLTAAAATSAAPRYIHHHFELNSYSAPMNMGFWSTIAPGVVSNYGTRMLLGRHYMCTAGEEEDLTEQHGQHALVKLAGYDVLLAVGHDELNDVIFTRGLGWTNGTFR
jgi:hypothetical protein